MAVHIPVGKWIATGLVVGAAFVVGVLAAAPAHAEARTKHKLASRPATTSFHFDNIPVRSALQLIAEEGGFNLVVSDSVQGNISLRLNDVTWQQALELVLRVKGLQQRIDGATRTVGTQ
jgi:type II secretory pathway component HofQ